MKNCFVTNLGVFSGSSNPCLLPSLLISAQRLLLLRSMPVNVYQLTLFGPSRSEPRSVFQVFGWIWYACLRFPDSGLLSWRPCPGQIYKTSNDLNPTAASVTKVFDLTIFPCLDYEHSAKSRQYCACPGDEMYGQTNPRRYPGCG